MFFQKFAVFAVIFVSAWAVIRFLIFKGPIVEGFIKVFGTEESLQKYRREKNSRDNTKAAALHSKIAEREQRAREANEASELADKAIGVTEDAAVSEATLSEKEKALAEVEEKTGFKSPEKG